MIYVTQFFCRKVHVLDLVLVLVLDQEAAPDPKDDLDPGLAQLHDLDDAALNHDHVPDHDLDRHDANRIPSRAQGPGHDPAHDLRANPSPDHVHVHAQLLDHPEMIKKHLRNLELMIIRIIIQQKEITPVKMMMLPTLRLSKILFLRLYFLNVLVRLLILYCHMCFNGETDKLPALLLSNM